MIRRRLFVGLAIAALIQASAGCTFEPVRLGSSEAVRYDPTRSRDVSGRACGFMLGGLVPIALSNRDQRAYRTLTEQAHGDYVADVEAEQRVTYAFVGWTICTEFHAVAYPRL
jgi:hypothetical protein